MNHDLYPKKEIAGTILLLLGMFMVPFGLLGLLSSINATINHIIAYEMVAMVIAIIGASFASF